MPVLGLDLDDTSAKYLHGLRDDIINRQEKEFFANMTKEEAYKHFPELRSYDTFEWTFIKGDRSKFEKYHVNAVENGLFRNLEVMENASEVLWQLQKECDLHVYVITSRFVKKGQHARVLSDTGIWLDQKNIPYRDIMFVKNKVDVIADIYLDDSPTNINALRAAGRNVVTFNQSYNTELPGPRVKDWNETYELIKNFCEQSK